MDEITWPLLVIAVITLITFLVTSTLGVYVSAKGQGYGSKGVKITMETILSLLLTSSILFPYVYIIYLIWKNPSSTSTSETSGGRLNARVSHRTILGMVISVYVLLVLTCSLALWMANASTWTNHNEANGIKITLIVLLVLSLVLPAFWIVFQNRAKICTIVQAKT